MKYLDHAAALVLVEQARSADTAILGVEGFFISGDIVRPSLDHILDLSGTTGASHDFARAFIVRSKGEVTHFDVVLAAPPTAPTYSMPHLATASALPAIIALTERAYAPYLPLLGYPPVPMTEDYAPRIERGEVWLDERDGALAGLIVLERHPGHAEIFSVAVDPAHHGAGLGRALLDFAVAKTREWNLPELRLYTNAKMERNIALYSRYGFRETGRRANPKRPQFTIVDMVLAV